MITTTWPGNKNWPLLTKIFFRFFCIYFLLYINPWTWVEFIPKAGFLTKYYYQLDSWAVHTANQYLFHGYKELVMPNGSGDTSYNWTQLWLYLVLSGAGCLIWSLLDRKRSQYNQLAYWIRIFVRYFLIINCFGYGISKVFSLQMSFPNLSQLATPLGDLLPMRLSWMFMGYSKTYQAFSGAMEVLAGVLLLYRRTSTWGTLLSAGIFTNVMIMNMGYDIPVKLFSTHLLIMCLFLLAFEFNRIVDFFLLNRTSASATIYQVRFSKKWMRIGRIILKCLFIIVIVILPFIDTRKFYLSMKEPKEIKPIRSGVYDVKTFVLNRDTLAPLISDSLRWQDMIFEKGGSGSVKTTDTIFRQRYRRGYFNYTTDTTKQEIEFKKTNVQLESFFLFRLKYEIPDSNTLVLKGMIRKDSVFVLLKRSNRHFQLAERQFHWLSEYNR